MEVFTVKEFQERFDELIVNGEHIGIVDENGRACIMMPTDDELMKLYVETNNEAP
jgi:hypothetical protein